MSKIVIISCTNRLNSNTIKVCRVYEEILKSKNREVSLFDFSLLPENIAFSELFGKRSPEYQALVENYITNSAKFIFIVPEYNGSFPGILKLVLDSIAPKEWANKDACLVGVSSGRAGNLRGMDQLTGVLGYLKMHVYHNKLPISLIDKILTAEGKFISDEQLKACEAQVDGFLNY